MVPEISLVLPVFQESAHIRESLRLVSEILGKNAASWEIVVVDDGSRDATWAELRAAKALYPNLRIARLSRNFGKEAALCAGLELARGEAVILMDGDLQHPPALIPDFINAWKAGAMVVEGVKVYRGKENLFYGLIARSFYSVLSAATKIDFRSASDFKLLDRRVVNAWQALPEKTLFFRGMVSWLGFPSKQIGFEVAPRAGGASSFGALRLIRLAWSAMAAYSAWPLHAITGLGVVFSVVSFLLLLQTLWNKIYGHAYSGFTTVITLQLLIGSVLILSIGVLGEYLAKIFEEVKGRPRYVIYEHEE